MAKSKKQIEARLLRNKGKSIKEIAKLLKVSKGSASIWCRDIVLTTRQIERLHKNMVAGSYVGRMKGAQIQKERRKAKILHYEKSAAEDIKELNNRELFIAGLCLYWGEGSRKSPPVKFFNSDPSIIKLMMRWFREIVKIPNDRFLMYITINKIHKGRLKQVKDYWSQITNIPVAQFRKPLLIKAKNKKVYENFNQHFGTFCIRIAKSSDLYYRILGWINALK